MEVELEGGLAIPLDAVGRIFPKGLWEDVGTGRGRAVAAVELMHSLSLTSCKVMQA